MTITSFQPQETIKAAAKAKDQDMYNEIEDLDLIAEEFKMHDHCRKIFLKGFGEQSRKKLKSGEPEVCFEVLNFSKTSLSILKKFMFLVPSNVTQKGFGRIFVHFYEQLCVVESFLTTEL